MKKLIPLIFISLIGMFALSELQSNSFADVSIRNYAPISLAKGSFLKAISQRDISSATVKQGDIEYFINPADVYVGTSNIFPKNSIFLGEIEEVVAPVEGINASMKIKIYKVVTPEEAEYELNANIFKNGSVNIGGDLSEVAYYARVPHYPGTWKQGVLQYVPTTIREMGKPVYIRAGEEVTIILNEDQSIYKPAK